nr:hypothetical protein [Tanacetum cinerariifolium]
VISADSAVTYTSVHSEARSWSIPSEDPYEEAAQQLLEHAPRSPEYVPDPIELEDHVPLHIPEYPEDLVPSEDEAYVPEVASAPTPLLLPSFLSPRSHGVLGKYVVLFRWIEVYGSSCGERGEVLGGKR